MVYQNLEADIYLEGDANCTIRLLTEALKAAGEAPDKHAERRNQWQREHDQRVAKGRSTQSQPPDGAENFDSATCAKRLIRFCRRYDLCRRNDRSQPDHSRIAGLGSAWVFPTYAKWSRARAGHRVSEPNLAARDRPVVMLIGDGSFLYNPVLPFLTFSKDQDLPILVVIFNNNKYEIMRSTHVNWYPDGVSAQRRSITACTSRTPIIPNWRDGSGGRGFVSISRQRLLPQLPKPMKPPGGA